MTRHCVFIPLMALFFSQTFENTLRQPTFKTCTGPPSREKNAPFIFLCHRSVLLIRHLTTTKGILRIANKLAIDRTWTRDRYFPSVSGPNVGKTRTTELSSLLSSVVLRDKQNKDDEILVGNSLDKFSEFSIGYLETCKPARLMFTRRNSLF